MAKWLHGFSKIRGDQTRNGGWALKLLSIYRTINFSLIHLAGQIGAFNTALRAIVETSIR